MSVITPDPRGFRYFDNPPDPSVVPILEEIAELATRDQKRRKVSRASWKRLKFRIRMACAGIDQEALAIGILIKHPDWSVGTIAAYVGAHRGTLHRWKTFQAIQEKIQVAARDDFLRNVPRGSKVPDSDCPHNLNRLEAWDEEEEEDEDEGLERR